MIVPMRVVMITINDPAGTASLMRAALERDGRHQCRLITTELRYNFMFPKDLHVPWLKGAALEQVPEVLEWADLFHFHMTADEHTPLGPYQAKDFMAGKRIVHHHHGHPEFRAHPERFQQKYTELGRRNLLVSTPDLLHKLPGTRWQPNFVPEWQPLYSPQQRHTNGAVRLGHSPTRKELKNTEDLLHVCAALAADLPQLELDIIENTRHTECLARKQVCDLFFDHMQGYFGMASLEALSQGIATIAGLDDWNQHCIKEFFGCDTLPWVLAHDTSQLAAAIRPLVLDTGMRQEKGRAAREFMCKVWSEKTVAGSLADWYENLS